MYLFLNSLIHKGLHTLNVKLYLKISYLWAKLGRNRIKLLIYQEFTDSMK